MKLGTITQKISALLFVSALLFTVFSPLTAFAQSPTPTPDSGDFDSGLTADEERAINLGYFLYRAQSAKCSDNQAAIGTITGDDNKAATYSFLIQKGLAPHQVGGIMGNLQAEGGFEPRLVEYGWLNSRGEKSVAGKPSSLDDEMPPSQNSKGQPGYGIAQWTSEGRKENLRKLAAERNVKVGTIGVQLEHLWREFEGPYKSVLEKIRRSTTLREASDYVLKEYEVPANRGTEVQEQRAGFGQKIMELYANDPNVASAASAAAISCGGGSTAAPGFVGFPLLTTKASIESKNKGQFVNGRMGDADHGYAAHDIVTDVGVPVVSLYDGTVQTMSNDRCGGRLITVYSQAIGVTLSYMHLSTAKDEVKKGDAVKAGQTIGFIGSAEDGCGTVHLHIDAITGDTRFGCSRLGCSQQTRSAIQEGSNIIRLPEQLYETYMKLP